MSNPAVGGASFVRRTAIWIPVGVVALLALPMAATSRSFGSDWTLHLWLVRQQQFNIEAMRHPGLFVSTTRLGAFYPIFAFVGSGIYSVGGYLAIALGDRPVLAYKVLYVFGLGTAYGGMTWLSVQRGLRGWRSQVAGLVFVTDAYMVTDLAGRGDLGEFMALAAIPLLLAAAYAVMTTPNLRVRHLVAATVGAFVFTGSHNITLLWGTVFIALLLVLMLIAYGSRLRRPLPWARVAALLGAAAIGAGLNAWYLFPDFAYGLDTSVARVSRGRLPSVVDDFAGALDPLRPAYSAVYRDVRMAMPWLFVVWAVVVAAALWRGGDRASRRLFVGVGIVVSALVVLVFAQTPWRWLPSVLWNLQFSWRLDAYIAIGAALLVMLALERHATGRSTVVQPASVALVALLVFSVGAATWQVWRVQSSYVHGARDVPTNAAFADAVVADRHTTPPSWRDFESFRDVSSKPAIYDPKRVMIVPLNAVNGSKFTGRLTVPRGPAPFRTNISAGPRFVRMTGIDAVGRNGHGFIVAVRSPAAPASRRLTVTIEPAENAVLRGGAIVSALSAIALLTLFLWPLGRFLTARTERP